MLSLGLEKYFPKVTGSSSQQTSTLQTSVGSSTCAGHIHGVKRRARRPVGRPRKKRQVVPEVVNLVSSESEGSDHESEGLEEQASSSSEKRSHVMHRMYSRGQKNRIAEYARHHGIRAAARHYGVHHKNVQRWRNEKMDKIKNPQKRSNRKGQGRKISYPQELEDQLVTWILEKREDSYVAVSSQMIRLKALSLIRPVNPQFKASEGWLRKFLRRNKFVLRARTSMSQSLPKDLEENIAAFRNKVHRIRMNSDFPYDLIANMDETPIFLDTVPSKTVDRKGKKSIRVRTTNSEKRHITATLCCTAAGKFLSPFVIFKGKTFRPLRRVIIPEGVIATTQKKGWMDEPRMLMWINKVWSPYVLGRPALLTLDTFKAHLTDNVKDAFDKCNTKVVEIPGGCTPVLQPLDVSINKPFKGYVRHAWTQYMLTESEKGDAKIPPPSKSLLLEWIKTAQDKIQANPTITKKSFLVCGISNALGSYEDHLIRNDTTYKEIHEIMTEVFGDEIIGYVEPSDVIDEDPCSDGSSNDQAKDDGSDSDPFSDGSD